MAPKPRHARLPLAGLLLLLAAATGCDRAAPRPNLLLVSIDSLRADHLHCHGNPNESSPRLDRLAAEGTRFETVLAPSSWTLPSHASLFTALPPASHRVVLGNQSLGEGAVTLAEVLKGEGYRTAAVAAGPYLSRTFGLDQGFDEYDESLIGSSLAEADAAVTSPGLVKLAVDFLDRWSSEDEDAPFFLFLHAWDVHHDYIPPPPHDRMFDPDYEGEFDGRSFHDNPAIHPGMPDRDLRHVKALYDGEIHWTDLHLGRVFDELERRGLLDDTLVVVTADHGDEFFEHGEKGHRKNLYDTTVLVPWILRWPGRVPAGRVIERQVSLTDVPATILGLLGVEPPEEFGAPDPAGGRLGVDLSPYLDGEPPARTLFADLEGVIALVRTDEHSFHMKLEGDIVKELYDLRADPLQQHDLAAEQPELLQRMSDELRLWRTRRAVPRSGGPGRADVDPELLEQLRSLGYVD